MTYDILVFGIVKAALPRYKLLEGKLSVINQSQRTIPLSSAAICAG